jgi:hypothetical protein
MIHSQTKKVNFIFNLPLRELFPLLCLMTIWSSLVNSLAFHHCNVTEKWRFNCSNPIGRFSHLINYADKHTSWDSMKKQISVHNIQLIYRMCQKDLCMEIKLLFLSTRFYAPGNLKYFSFFRTGCIKKPANTIICIFLLLTRFQCLCYLFCSWDLKIILIINHVVVDRN